MSFHLPAGLAAEVTYETKAGRAAIQIPDSRDPFDVLDHVQRKLFPVLSEEGWNRLLEHRKLEEQRERERRQREAQ